MVEDTYLDDWAELVDKIVQSLCKIISTEGGNDPISIVEREYGKLSTEQQFLLEYLDASYWDEDRKGKCVALAEYQLRIEWGKNRYQCSPRILYGWGHIIGK